MTRERLLDELRRSEVDMDAARALVEERALAGRRRRRLAAGVSGATAVLAVLAAVAFTFGGADPDDVVADRDDRTNPTVERDTTSSTEAPPVEPEPSVETTPPPSTAAPTTAPTTTQLALAPDAPPVAPAAIPAPSTPTVAPQQVNEPLTARLTVATPRVAAGSTTAVDITWSDADHSGIAPSYVVDWGDPAVGGAAPIDPVGTCDRPGQPAGATDRLEFRHATPGRHRIRVELRTCASGPFAERIVLDGTVEVTEPTLAGVPAVAVVLHRGDDDALLLPALDAASARLGERALPARDPVLSQRVGRGAATVVVMPRDADGEVALEWPSTSCRARSVVTPAGLDLTSAPKFVLSSSC